MSKFVIKKDGNFLSAGKVIKETGKTFFTDRIEGCPFGYLTGKCPKGEIVFETEDQNKIVRIMAAYTLMFHQHSAVVDAANDALQKNIDILTGCSKDKVESKNK
jgi:hypothetical protein